MTDYDRYTDPAEPGTYDPSLGGYLDHQPPPPVNGDFLGDAFADDELTVPAAPVSRSHSRPISADRGSDGAGFDSAGFDSAGFDSAGFDSAGFDSAGYDSGGYDSGGYDSGGYDSAGFGAPSVQDFSADAVSGVADDNHHGGMAPGAWGAPLEDEQGWSTPATTHQEWSETSWDSAGWEDNGEALPAAEDRQAKEKKSLSSATIFGGFLTIAVVVIAGAAFLAFQVANQTPAGPKTPEAAVAALLEAAAAEDVLGMAETLLPSERESLVEPSLALVDELKRVGLLASDTNLEKVGGLDVTTANLTMAISEVAPDVQWVTLNGGTIVVSGAAGALPFADGDGLAEQIENETNFAENPASFAVVRENGYWYLSVWYTVAENLRQARDLPRPALPRQAVGSRNPQEAVARFVNGAVDMRPSEMLTSMDPLEMRAAYDYSSLYLTDLDQSALEFRRELRADGSTWNLASLDTSVQEAGDRALVSIDAFVLTGTDGLSKTFTISFEDGCLTSDADGVIETVCGGDEGFPEIPYQLRVVKRDGEWFVSALPNLIYPYVDYLQTVETDRFETFGDLFGELTNLSSVSETVSDFGGSADQNEAGWVRVFTAESTIPAGTLGSDVIDYIVSDEFPTNLVPGGAILDLKELNGTVARFDIDATLVLTSDMFEPAEPGQNPVDPDPTDPDEPQAAPSEPADGSLFPAGSVWKQVPNEESVIYALNSDAANPLWVAERTDGSTVLQITKVRRLGELRSLNFSPYRGWQKARNIEFDGYANPDFAVVIVEEYLVVSLDPLDDSGILMEQARYLYQQIR